MGAIRPFVTPCTRVLVVGLILLVAHGCGTKKFPVVGKVVFKDDGSPLPGGLITLSPLDPASRIGARGVIQMDGTFEIGTDSATDGSLAGKYQVVVMPLVKSKNEDDPNKGKMPIHSKYLHFETSGLEIEIKPEKNDILLKVERPPGTRKS